MLRRLSWIGMLLLLIGCDPAQPIACFIPVISIPSTQLATGQRLVMINEVIALEPAPNQPIQLRFVLQTDPSKVFVIDLNQQQHYFYLYKLEKFFDIRLLNAYQCQLPDKPLHYNFTLELVAGDQTYTQPLELVYQPDINAFGYYSLNQDGRATDITINWRLIVIFIGFLLLVRLTAAIYVDIINHDLCKPRYLILLVFANLGLIYLVFNINSYKYQYATPLYCYAFNARNEQNMTLYGTIMLPNAIISQDSDINLYPMYQKEEFFELNLYKYYYKYLPEIKALPSYPDCDKPYNFSYKGHYLIQNENTTKPHTISIAPSLKHTLEQDIKFVQLHNITISIVWLCCILGSIRFWLRMRR